VVGSCEHGYEENEMDGGCSMNAIDKKLIHHIARIERLL
jgi:hypothetical protein